MNEIEKDKIKISEIPLELNSNKVGQFYLALNSWHRSGKKDLEALTKMADAIVLDYDKVTLDSLLTSEQEVIVQGRLKAIYKFCEVSSKYSNDYSVVGCINEDAFIQSDFGKELTDLFTLLELSQKWIGKEKSQQFKCSIGLWIYFKYQMENLLPLNLQRINSNKILSKSEIAYILKQLNLKIYIQENGKINFYKGEKDIQFQIYLEKNATFHLLELKKENESKIIDSAISGVVCLLSNKEAFLIKSNSKDLIISIYKNAKIIKKKIDFTNTKFDCSFKIPRKQIDRTLKKIKSYNEVDFYTFIMDAIPKKGIVVSFEDREFKDNYLHKEIEMSVDSSTKAFSEIEDYLLPYIKRVNGKSDEIQIRHSTILKFYRLLTKHYPEAKVNILAIITGFIASQLGLLDTKSAHIDSNRKQTYRKYLKDSVFNVINGKLGYLS